MLKLILSLMVLLSCTLQSFAMSPEDYCDVHTKSEAPGECEVRGSCAVLLTNLGTEECKKCDDGGCELVDCSECE